MSLWTVGGRLKDVPFVCSPDELKALGAGYKAAGRKLNRYRKRQQRLRAKLQNKGTKSAKRLLKKRSRREQRRAKDINHRISKTIVAEAERTGRGIALEELTGIRARVRHRKPWGYLPAEGWGRATIHSWSFAQLVEFIAYKARRAGVPVVYVAPAYTSQTCCRCGHTDRNNRINQALFHCRSCGVVAHADRNASRNIAARGETAWNAGRPSPAPATHIKGRLRRGKRPHRQ